MDADLKKTLKAVTLELRHLLEGRYDNDGKWKPGDLEQRLAAIGVRRDRTSVPVDELGHLAEEDRQARKVVDAYLKLRDEAGVERSEAVGDFVRETAYTWANRLLALRCMEARELIDSVILQQDAYGGRSLEHHRLAQRNPELCAGDDDGLFAVLDKVFRAQTERLPMLFDPQAPGIALRPSAATLKDCFGLLSLNPDTLHKYRVRLTEDEGASPVVKPPTPFTAPDALGWAYQYWNTEEKNRVFEKVRTVKGAKIAGADIIPATQLYTEDYMVKFLVQNSLGATWMGMHPESKLAENWEYYVKDADRAPVEKKPVREITFLDPACGSGHFHLEAFDLFYAMYQEEGELTAPEDICNAILTKNLFGIDIDPRAVQIAEVALWMKAAERAFDYKGVPTNLVAATSSHLKGEAWEEFLAGFEREPSVARVLRSFAGTMEHIDEIGSLARPAEDLRDIIKEEHATWERQVSEKKEVNYLFPEMNKAAVSGQLPFQHISDEDFGDRLFYRAKAGIDAFTERARESGEFEDRMLGNETRAGFRLVELLSGRYDVVAANPPYMGSGNMASAVKAHVERVLKSGKGDLYAAFILRNSQLASPNGRVAMVTQQSWMFLNSFLSLRKTRDAAGIGGLLATTSIEAIAQLGRYAFTEIGNAAVSPVLFILSASPPQRTHRIWACRLTAPRPASEQAGLLSVACRRLESGSAASNNRFTPLQKVLCELPEAQLFYWLSEKCLSLLKGRTLEDVAHVAEPTTTGDSERFFRGAWECNPGDRWRWASRGGGHRKWAGFKNWVIDWQFDGARMRSASGSYLRNTQLMFRPGLTYTEAAYGAFAVRELRGDECFAKSGPGIIPLNGQVSHVAAILNSRVTSYLLRASARSFLISIGSVRGVPVPEIDGSAAHVAEVCIQIKKAIVSADLTERDFEPASLVGVTTTLTLATVLHSLEGEIEQAVGRAFGFDADGLRLIYNEVGTAVALLPVIAGRDEVPVTEMSDECRRIVRDQTRRCSRVELADADLTRIKRALRGLLERGGLAEESEFQPSVEGSGPEEEDSCTGATFPIPAETLLEEICNEIRFHPISVLNLLIEGIEREGWRCMPEERRLRADRVTVTVLRLLGHRWPKQIESGEAIPDWADPDGIIPLTSVAKESTLFDSVQQQIKADRIDAGDFAEVMAKPLDPWLATEFFKYHIKQFKKRPIAWQLQSGKFTAKQPPAFACLLYYHKLDADTLPKLRSQYIVPLRQRLETEQRGILAVAADARSERQVKRRGELEDLILELQKFETVLETVARTGFGPQPLLPTLRQFAFDDAMLALKVRWLRRLTDVIAKSPLPDWLAAADRTKLHPDFHVWIADVMAHLDYFCAQVGPKAPDQSKIVSDPVPVDLAKLITPHAREMLKDTLKLSCEKWYAQFDEVVLGPDKDKLKTLREEQKSCEEQLDADPAPSTVEVQKLKYRVKEIKEEAKILTAQIKRRKASANKVRDQIESWQSKEPLGWGDWLAGQPLFDGISSLDGRRPAPTTVAEFVVQESLYAPDINDGVRVNIAPLQKAGVLAADVIAGKDIDKAIADRAEWRADERRWAREGKLLQPGWWPENGD